MGASGLSTSSLVAWESDGALTSGVLLGIRGSTSRMTGSCVEVDKSFLPTCGEEIGLSSS
eukprot:10475254-Ditylum_brightwellii.AAC.1